MPGDASTDAACASSSTRHTADLGHVDVFFANAGIGTLAGLEASDAEWPRMLEANLMAHVRAARHLVPRWLDAGGGRLVVTASAAGLLTMLGDAPYSVSKHGAVAFAEWLSATYRHRGIVVQAICPQGVQTRMLDGSGPLKDLLTRDATLTPERGRRGRLAGARQRDFYVLPHPEVRRLLRRRAAHPDAWLAGMNRLQQKLDSQPTPPITSPTSDAA